MTNVATLKEWLERLPQNEPIWAVVYCMSDMDELVALANESQSESGLAGATQTDETRLAVGREAVRLFDKFDHAETYEGFVESIKMAQMSIDYRGDNQ